MQPAQNSDGGLWRKMLAVDELAAGTAQIRAAKGDERLPTVRLVAQRMGSHVTDNAMNQQFAVAAIQDAAAATGLLAEHGRHALRLAIVAGMGA